MKTSPAVIPVGLLLWAWLAFPHAVGLSQPPPRPKGVLVLQWYDRTYDANLRFTKSLNEALQAIAPGGFEQYSEYIETNKFPGEDHAWLLTRYLRDKYANRPIDVVVARTSVCLDFLLANRDRLFPDTPIVFATNKPVSQRKMSDVRATGIVYANTYTRTLELAAKLHPRAKHLFVVSGTLDQDKSLENIARQELQGYKGALSINYLTDLSPGDLTSRMRNLPQDSLILYVWQQAMSRQGLVMESADVLALIAREAKAPIYGMSVATIGAGSVGGYVWTFETNAPVLAGLISRVTNGESAADIPVIRAPEVPMFDWRQLQRWGISARQLPPNSAIRFREPTMWERYKWRIILAAIVLALQALLIGALLIERHRSQRARTELERHRLHLEELVGQRTKEVVQARDQAESANRLKSVFLASMSHELRTPLNAILGFSRLLGERASFPDDRADLDNIARSGEHLLALINDVLDMAKIEAGRLTLDVHPCDFRSLVQEVGAMMSVRARQKRLELRIEGPADTMYVLADAPRLRQTMINLVGNAIQYTDRGSVTLRWRTGNQADRDRVLLMFETEDTGVGIAASDKDRIFDAFVQVGPGEKTRGTGLGLAITRQLVELMGGTIQVESTPGEGSLFRVEIVVERAAGLEPRAASIQFQGSVQLEPHEQEWRVLVVDDEPGNRIVLQRMLESAGFRTEVAVSGDEAVAGFDGFQPHFIWMDLRMHGMDGVTAMRRIRALDGGSNVRIAAVTASAVAGGRESALQSGFDAYLVKPYRPGDIFECMANHLPVRFRQKSEAGANGSDELESELRPEDLSGASAELLAELRDAIISLDATRISAAIARVSELHPTSGHILARYAGRYLYTPILRAIAHPD